MILNNHRHMQQGYCIRRSETECQQLKEMRKSHNWSCLCFMAKFPELLNQDQTMQMRVVRMW